MSEETFAISLGGKTWPLPHLPFRAIKAIQPALFDIYLAAGGSVDVGRQRRTSGRAPTRSSGGSDLARDLLRRA